MNKKKYKNHITFMIIIIIFCINFSLILFSEYSSFFQMNNQNEFYWIISLFLLSNSLVIFLLYRLQKRNYDYEVSLYNQKEEALITLNSIGDGVITTDENGFITFLNPIAQKLTNHTISEAKGKYLDDVFTLINENSTQEISSPIKKVLSKGKTGN